MNANRPSWAATAMTITDNEMSDAERDTSTYLRVLVADFAHGTLCLRSAEHVEATYCMWWPIPRIPAATIQTWLPEILPAVQALCDAAVETEHGYTDYSAADAAGQQITEAVDALHAAWYGRPAPHGLLARCRHCDSKIRIVAGVGNDYCWVHDSAPLDSTVAWFCSGPDGGQTHEPVDDGQSGSPMVDLRPYHEFECQPTGTENVTGRCACGGWRSERPGPYIEISLAYVLHTDTLVHGQERQA